MPTHSSRPRLYPSGKAGLISRISEAMSARICKVVALGPGSDRDRGKFYFQRFAGVLPAAGEMVLMYRSAPPRALAAAAVCARS